jgi:hypothetical protein
VRFFFLLRLRVVRLIGLCLTLRKLLRSRQSFRVVYRR